MIRLGQQDRQALGILLSPSWLSGLIAVAVGLTVTIGVIVTFSINTSAFQRQLVSWQQTQHQKPLTTGAHIPGPADKPSLKNSWPLLVVWAIIGLIVYSTLTAVVHYLNRAEDIKRSLEYVNARPDDIIKNNVEHLVLRVTASFILGALIVVFFKVTLPYSITAAHAAAAEISPLGFLYTALSFASVVLGMHLQAIFLRLALGRLRVFDQELTTL